MQVMFKGQGPKNKTKISDIEHRISDLEMGASRRRWGRWLGWSRNKVAVSEGAAGSPPF